jgi:GTP cyclohydrolase I
MNNEVSMWMKCSGEDTNDEIDIPFIATRGYDSVVWSRMYSQDPAERTSHAVMVRQIQLTDHMLLPLRKIYIIYVPTGTILNFKYLHTCSC